MRLPPPWIAAVSISVACLAAPSGEDTSLPGCVECVLSDAGNYSYTASIELARLPLQARQDGSVDWSGLTEDLAGWPVADGGAVDQARLLAFRELEPEAVAAGLTAGSLSQDDVALFSFCRSDDQRCALSEFLIGWAPLDVQDSFSDDYATWLVLVGRSGSPEVLGAAVLSPTDDVGDSVASLTSSSASLQVDVDLRSLEPLRVSTGAELRFDWSALTVDGLGKPLDPQSIDGLTLGYYVHAEHDLDQLEAQALVLDRIADGLWTAEVGGRLAASTTELTGQTTFAGVDSTGIWLLELTCSLCLQPGPRFVTVLATES